MEERLRELPVNHGGLYRPLKAMTMPGMDALGDGNSTTGKLVNMESPQFPARAAAAISRLHSDGRVLCEAGGGAGWGSNLSRFKSQLDWLFASGVTFVNPHQSLLSVKGLRKRDFPTSHFVQEPWFELYRLHSELVSRMSALASHGDPVLELALLFPISALRAAGRGRGRKQGETLKSLVMSFDSVMEFLVRHQRDFELVFEESLSSGLVKVEKGKLKAGRRKFQALIVPPCELIHRDAATLLKQLLETGGKVLAFGDLPARDHEGREILSELLPAFREALKNGRAVQVPERRATSREGLLAALDRLHPPSLELECAFREQVVCREWRFEDGAACFIANLGQETGAAELCFKTFKDVLERWDPETGAQTEWPYQTGGDGRARVKLELGPFSSLVLVWREDKKAKRRPRVIDADLEILDLNAARLAGITDRAKSAVTLADSAIELSGESPPLPLALKPEWELVPERKNIFLIEPWKVKTSRVQKRPLEDMEREPFFSKRTRRVIRLGRLLATIVQTLRPPERRYRTERYFEFADAERGNAIVSRLLGLDLDRLGLYQAADTLLRIADYLGLRTFMRNFPPLGAEYRATASFKVDYIPDDLHLVYEDLGVPVGFELNKKPLRVEPRPAEAWDPCCRALPVADLVRKGKNRIVMKSRQLAFPALPPNTHSLEPVALMGGFAAGRVGIEKPVAGPAAGGDWKERGYPFYSGPMILRTTFHLPEHYLSCHLVLELSEVRETVELKVNGRAAGARIYPPFRFPVSGLVRAGENLVEARVLNTAANLFDKPRPSGIPGLMRIVPYQRFEIALDREKS